MLALKMVPLSDNCGEPKYTRVVRNGLPCLDSSFVFYAKCGGESQMDLKWIKKFADSLQFCRVCRILPTFYCIVVLMKNMRKVNRNNWADGESQCFAIGIKENCSCLLAAPLCLVSKPRVNCHTSHPTVSAPLTLTPPNPLIGRVTFKVSAITPFMGVSPRKPVMPPAVSNQR